MRWGGVGMPHTIVQDGLMMGCSRVECWARWLVGCGKILVHTPLCLQAVWAGWGHASENPKLPELLCKHEIAFLGEVCPPSGWDGVRVTFLGYASQSKPRRGWPAGVGGRASVRVAYGNRNPCSRYRYGVMLW